MMSSLLKARYNVMREMSNNEAGQSFLAEDTHSQNGAICFVKHFKLDADGDESLNLCRNLFEQEAQKLYHLNEHDRIQKLLAHFEENGEFFLVYEYIAGRNIEKEIEQKTLQSESLLVELMGDILEPLSFAHLNQIAHQNIKPSNLIRRNEDGRIVLTDFDGVRQACANLSSEHHTNNFQLSSDIYSVGLIAVKILTGCNPDELQVGENGEFIWDKTKASPDLAKVIEQMLRTNFRLCFQNANEALQALNALSDKEVETEVTPPKQEIVVPVIPMPQRSLHQEESVPQPPATQQTTPQQEFVPQPQQYPPQQQYAQTDSFAAQQPYAQQPYPQQPYPQNYQQQPYPPQDYAQAYPQQPYAQQPYQQTYPPQYDYSGQQMPQQPYMQTPTYIQPNMQAQTYYNAQNYSPATQRRMGTSTNTGKPKGKVVAVVLVLITVVSLIVVAGVVYRKKRNEAAKTTEQNNQVNNQTAGNQTSSPDSSAADENAFKTSEFESGEAQKIAQTAQYSSDWDLAAQHLQKAVEALRTIEASSPRFDEAQKKIKEYVSQLDNARKQSQEMASRSSGNDPSLPIMTGGNNDDGPVSQPSARSENMYLSFNSSRGDYRTGKRNFVLTQANGSFNAQVSGNNNEIRINVDGGSESYTLTLGALKGEKLSVGTYSGAQRSSFRAPNRPGLELYGSGLGCSMGSGNFVIRSIDISNGVLLNLDASFNQQCDNGPSISGRIRYRVSR